MYTITCFEKSGAALFYHSFTSARFRPRLQVLKPEDTTIAIGASSLGKPIGLALAEVFPEDNSAEILSIFVAPGYRRQKVGTALLIRLEKELFIRGCNKAKLFCKVGKPIALALERMLQKSNWSTPQPWDIRYKSDRSAIAEAPWFKMKFRLPSDMIIFPWTQITDQERALIQETQKSNPWFEEALSPFQNEKNFEPLNSLGLRYRGQVVGWMLTERVASDTIYYKCMFVRKDLQKLGRGIALFINATKIQYYEASIPKGVWRVKLDNPLMIRFVKKYMMPYLTSFEDVSYSYKLLIDN